VDALLESVGASEYADEPVGNLSGGEQQRLRVGQALAGDPRMLLCDEPLLSLDLQHQRGVSELIDRRRREHGTPVVFVTHDVNPVLGMVDRILYLAGGQFREGTPDEVLRSEVLTELYGTPVEVLRTGGRVVVVGIPDSETHHHGHAEAGS
jgi:zinc/manganese transport system ATP-binding protein